MVITETEFRIDGRDGHRIEAYQWRGEHSGRGVVQIVHGMAEHSRRSDLPPGGSQAALAARTLRQH